MKASIKQKPEALATAITQASSEHLLQASRRVDWRFLLPEPALGQVAYWGMAKESLLHSLSLFSSSLSVFEMASDGGHPISEGQYDLMVISEPHWPDLRPASRFVRVGGYIYIEVSRLPEPRQLRRRLLAGRASSKGLWPAGASRYVAAIEAMGFEDVRPYWHWPNFERCTKIIPLDDRGSLLSVLAPDRTGLKATSQAVVGRWLLRSGLLMHLITHFSVVARRGAE